MRQLPKFFTAVVASVFLIFGVNFMSLYIPFSVTLTRASVPAVLHQNGIVNEVRIEGDRSKKMNVLFLVSDDLRPQLNCLKGKYYPNPESSLQMHTPNIDKLAQKSLVLTQAYVQFAVCGPSRASYMTGRRPDKTQVWDLITYWRESGGNFTTLPQYFKENGYATAGIGKIYQPGIASHEQDPPSWTMPYTKPLNYYQTNDSWKSVPRAVRASVGLLVDEQVADISKELLRVFAENIRTKQQPFFLAAGFYKPHMPLVCGEEFSEYYDPNGMDLPEYGFLPRNFPEAAFHPPGEFVGKPDLAEYHFTGAMNETFPDDVIRMLRRAYFACVSQIDHLVGEILDELERLGLANSTVVSFIGDHGFHLGENGLWGKHTNFHFSTRAPMIIHVPGKTNSGIVSDSLVEFVDLFPTVVEAAGLGPVSRCPRDSSNIPVCTDGRSLLPLIDNPHGKLAEAIFSQLHVFRGINGMYYSMRTERFLYNEVVPFNQTPNANGSYRYDILWEAAPGAELYDLLNDPGERVNLAGDTSYLRTRAALSRQLHDAVESFASLENVKVVI